MNEKIRPQSIKISAQLLVLTTIFAVFLFISQSSGLSELYGSWFVPLLSVGMCAFWLLLTWYLYLGRRWARNILVILLVLSIGYTALNFISISGVSFTEFLQTAGETAILILILTPASLQWVKNDS